jgi:hypothetical protein
MRVAVGGYLVAVNTFATQPVGLDAFQRGAVSGDALLKPGRGESAVSGFIDSARERNWDMSLYCAETRRVSSRSAAAMSER